MAPAAVAIPQFVANANNPPTTEAHLRDGPEWNDSGNIMESALDFDLLAEYLLEDVGAGGFDFGNPEAASPTIDLKTTQPASVVAPQDPGVVTPNGGSSFVEDASQQLQLQQPPAATAPGAGGDPSGELSQAQQMIAANQQVQATAAAAATPKPPPPQPQIQRPPSQPAATNGTGAMMAVRQQQQQANPAVAAAAAPLAPAPLAQRPQMPVVVTAQQQANKRPRVDAPPPSAKGPSYSFASSASAPSAATAYPHALPPGAPPQPAASAAVASLAYGAGATRQKSQAQIDRRRERNRILARRTRLRKKFFFESLQKDVADLQRENAALKSIVRSRLRPDDARAVLEKCNANERLPSAIHAETSTVTGFSGVSLTPATAAGLGAGASADPGVKKLDREDFSLIQSIQNSQQCFVITDPSLHDNPIVYASDDFLTLTGYSQEEVLGRNCRFLQGTETCQDKVVQIRKAVQTGEDVNVTFVNYTSDGRAFWNSLFIAALRDAENNIVNFIGVIVKVAGPEPGDSEYGKVLK